jgi:hypothetical protein
MKKTYLFLSAFCVGAATYVRTEFASEVDVAALMVYAMFIAAAGYNLSSFFSTLVTEHKLAIMKKTLVDIHEKELAAKEFSMKLLTAAFIQTHEELEKTKETSDDTQVQEDA